MNASHENFTPYDPPDYLVVAKTSLPISKLNR